MKKITLVFTLFLLSMFCFAQDTEAPTTPINFQFVSNPLTAPDSISVEWEHATDNVGVATYEIYINGILEEIIDYDGSNAIQYAPFLYFNNGTYCLTILARDAAGNASPLSNQICKSVNVIYQNSPRKPYIAGLLNYAGDDKAIEIANLSFVDYDSSDFTIKISYDGSSTWDTVYTFPANMNLTSGTTYIIAHPNISICTGDVDEYNSTITNFDGNDVVGLFKYDILYDMIGEWGNSGTTINTDLYIKRNYMNAPIPNTSFDLSTWDTYTNNGNCPPDFGNSSLVLLGIDEQEFNSFQIYPNPTNGNIVYINTKNSTTITSIQIFDITGKQVLQQVNPASEINVQSLERGLYIFQLNTDNQTITKKLIKQ